MPKSKKSDAEIAEAAYHLWREEGEPHGNDQEFWYRAEAELTTPKTRKKPAAKKPAAKAAGTAKKPAAKKPAAAKAKAPARAKTTRAKAPKA